jgi:MoaA/NifB/PqqE/SkfB family radical SAM enzyme
MMPNLYYKGYWMVTNRCNLRCSYCVLENAPHQLKQELSLEEKKELVSHLYSLGFRRLTLSGGEVLIIGKSPPKDFIELLRHMRQYRSKDPTKNLEIEMYTNTTYLSEEVASEMEGVVDLVAITIDGTDNEFLTRIGRNNARFNSYYDRAIQGCSLLYRRGIQVKLHSVVGEKNHLQLSGEVSAILDDLEKREVQLTAWKFYQYMSYDMPERDQLHSILKGSYEQFQKRVEDALEGRKVSLHFKDNEEMNASLFNILSYGNAQYMRDGDTWSSSQRTEDLRTYDSMEQLFAKNEINKERFNHFHGIFR